jgi:Obg family GTPase CgtA-like protein
VVVLNKIDVPDARELAEMVAPDLEARGLPVFRVSTASHEGLRELSFALAKIVEQDRVTRPPLEASRIVLRPPAVDEAGFTVAEDPAEPGAFIVRGERPERWVRQTAFDNNEAVGYLADRLARLGVEKALAEAGATPGCPVTIGEVTFDWEPSTPAGGEVLLYERGSDPRLDRNSRVGAAERKAAKRARRGLDAPPASNSPGSPPSASTHGSSPDSADSPDSPASAPARGSSSESPGSSADAASVPARESSSDSSGSPDSSGDAASVPAHESLPDSLDSPSSASARESSSESPGSSGDAAGAPAHESSSESPGGRS